MAEEAFAEQAGRSLNLGIRIEVRWEKLLRELLRCASMRFATPPSTRSPLTPPPEANLSSGGGQAPPVRKRESTREQKPLELRL